MLSFSSSGSFQLRTPLLKYSAGVINVGGGAGGPSAGHGGSAGRIAIVCTANEYASAAWSAWADLQLLAVGGNNSARAQGAAGSVFVDCGARNL
jgi:hypothetical protein